MIGTNFGIFRPNAGSTNNTSNNSINTPVVNTSQQQHIVVQPAAPVVIPVEDHRPQGQQLSDFILQLEDYVPTVPDSVTAHYLNSAGFESNDVRIVRLISVATQKFISDVANDALQHCKSRNLQAGVNLKSKDRKYSLTMDDLAPALSDYGIQVRKCNYYS